MVKKIEMIELRGETEKGMLWFRFVLVCDIIKINNDKGSLRGKCMNEKYPMLLSMGRIGEVCLKNKIVMSAMGMNQSDHGYVNNAVIDHYVRRAKGGVGLIIVEVTCIDGPTGKNTNHPLMIDDDKYIPGMRKLVEAIHREGAKCFLQLSHAGRGAFRRITGVQPVAPSEIAMPYTIMMELSNEKPRALLVEEIHRIEEKYAQGAYRAKEAGFDGVEIHSAGYYLGQQFLSSTANVRTDEYGGSRENRVRFHCNIIDKIYELCGEQYPIIVKLSAMEQGEYAGITLEDGIYYAKRFQDKGVNAIEVVAGTWKARDDAKSGKVKSECQTAGLCCMLKKGIERMTGKPATIQMIGGGCVHDPANAEKVLAKHQCDLIFAGRQLLVQEDYVKLVETGKESEIKSCRECGYCMRIQLKKGLAGNCLMNRGTQRRIAEAEK